MDIKILGSQDSEFTYCYYKSFKVSCILMNDSVRYGKRNSSFKLDNENVNFYWLYQRI